MHLLLLFCLCLLSYLSQIVIAEPDHNHFHRLKELSQDTKWQRLLHIQNPLFSSKQSAADGSEFFLAKDGKKNPLSELEANYKAFLAPPLKDQVDQHARCRFPLRFHWLSEHFSELKQLPPLKCPLFERFYNSIEPTGVSLVFSSYYLNNPSSVFGHTLLRIHRKPPKNNTLKAELLDSGINYAANPTTKNPLLYSIYGLIGVFPGTFAKLPYYYKVREYAENESRDLWSYDLSLTQQQLDDLVRHLWELGQTHFDYYFLTENCSYLILGALDAVNPSWKLTERMTYYVIPSETIKIVYKTPNLVNNVTFRPSARRLFISSYETLSSEEKKRHKQLFNDNPSSLEFADSDSVQLIDTAIDYVDYKHSNELFMEEKKALELKQSILSQRAKKGINPNRKISLLNAHDGPHNGHGTKDFHVSGGYSEKNYGFLQLGYRFAFHNKLEQLQGYPEDTSIDILSIKVRSYNTKKLPRIHEFSILKIESFNPLRAYENPISWRGSLNFKRTTGYHCTNCLPWSGDFSSGITLETLAKIRLYSMLNVSISGSQHFTKGYLRSAIGPSIGFFRPMYGIWSVGSEMRYMYFPQYAKSWILEYEIESRLKLTNNWEISVKTQRSSNTKDYLLSAHYFF